MLDARDVLDNSYLFPVPEYQWYEWACGGGGDVPLEKTQVRLLSNGAWPHMQPKEYSLSNWGS